MLLLGIVGIWLAVLVPMALRSHDSSTSLSSVDRFSDAMRVLARREQQGRSHARTFVLPPKPGEPGQARPPVPLAVRRRRVLLSMLGLSLVLLVVAVLGSMWALAGHLLVDVLIATYIGHLRRHAIRKAERQVRAAGQRPARPRPVRIAGIPDRMPVRPAPLAVPLPVPAARYEDPQPGTWDAPQFPVPTYVTAPVAPPRPTRVVDLTRPGRWSESLDLDDAGLAILDEPDELDDILDGRRASGDW
ncbi:MAG: hypothetical protein LC779_14925 [Actinobacteria bacterium]|nr:hypothetical protein [Actinomycetota bacterium]